MWRRRCFSKDRSAFINGMVVASQDRRLKKLKYKRRRFYPRTLLHGVANDGIYRMMHYLSKKGGNSSLAISDLVADVDGLYVVLEWDGPPDRLVPLVYEKIDPERLEVFEHGGLDYLYRGQIEDPREES